MKQIRVPVDEFDFDGFASKLLEHYAKMIKDKYIVKVGSPAWLVRFIPADEEDVEWRSESSKTDIKGLWRQLRKGDQLYFPFVHVMEDDEGNTSVILADGTSKMGNLRMNQDELADSGMLVGIDENDILFDAAICGDDSTFGSWLEIQSSQIADAEMTKFVKQFRGSRKAGKG
jgi:hypothetical protein